jgi:hypothetical protein
MTPQEKYNNMVTPKSWNDFRETGLFLFINSILHTFGWAIVVEVEKETGEVIKAYPARVKFRGFSESDQAEAHVRIGNYLKENADELAKEASE